jgi:hypothetical protein
MTSSSDALHITMRGSECWGCGTWLNERREWSTCGKRARSDLRTPAGTCSPRRASRKHLTYYCPLTVDALKFKPSSNLKVTKSSFCYTKFKLVRQQVHSQPLFIALTLRPPPPCSSASIQMKAFTPTRTKLLDLGGKIFFFNAY